MDIGASSQKRRKIAYDYFNLTDSLIMQDHKCKDILPKCCEVDNNYYVMNNLVFSTKTKLYKYIDSTLKKGIYEFDFRYEGKENATKLSSEIARYILDGCAIKGVQRLR